jgi:hypothetical protein
MADITTYEQITYAEAQRLLQTRLDGIALPTKQQIEARAKFDNDDHWQDGKGFIGQLPSGDDASDRLALLRAGFCPENVIAEVLDTHIENVLGDEPQISLEAEGVSESELESNLEIVKEWFDYRNNLEVLSNGLRIALRDKASVPRAFVPSGMMTGSNQTVKAKDLKDALSKIWFRSETLEKGGVIVNEDTATELGLFLYRMRVNQTDISFAEYAYLRDETTIWGNISAHEQQLGQEDPDILQLGGRLPITELKAKPLITESVCQMQRALNLSNTMLTRNNNLAGSRERLLINVQPRGEWVENGTDADGNAKMKFVPEPMATGPGTMNFLQSQAVRDTAGVETAFANPNVIFTDPVPIESFTGTRDFWYRNILAKCKQRHILMQDDATASGRSRIEARKEFEASLQKSKAAVDPVGAWMIEIALNLAAHFMGKPGMFLNYRAKFDAQVSVSELTAEESAEIRNDYAAGLLDKETAITLQQRKNVGEILDRLKKMPAPPAPPTN